MPKRTIEINDDLDELVDAVKKEIRENFIQYMRDNPDTEDFDDYYQAQGADTVSQAADSNTPIYNSHIDGLYYLYGNEFDEAYRNAGIGHGGEDNYRQIAICMYLEGKGHDYLREIQDAFEEWIPDQQLPESPLEDGSIAIESTIEDFIKSLT